jgi:hypothetical protein
VAAAAVLATLQGPAAAAAGNGASGPAAAQQELLALLLGHNARLPAQMAGALLQQGLAGKLPDGLTAKVSRLARCCLAAGSSLMILRKLSSLLFAQTVPPLLELDAQELHDPMAQQLCNLPKLKVLACRADKTLPLLLHVHAGTGQHG